MSCVSTYLYLVLMLAHPTLTLTHSHSMSLTHSLSTSLIPPSVLLESLLVRVIQGRTHEVPLRHIRRHHCPDFAEYARLALRRIRAKLPNCPPLDFTRAELLDAYERSISDPSNSFSLFSVLSPSGLYCFSPLTPISCRFPRLCLPSHFTSYLTPRI